MGNKPSEDPNKVGYMNSIKMLLIIVAVVAAIAAVIRATDPDPNHIRVERPTR